MPGIQVGLVLMQIMELRWGFGNNHALCTVLYVTKFCRMWCSKGEHSQNGVTAALLLCFLSKIQVRGNLVWFELTEFMCSISAVPLSRLRVC